MNIKNLKIKKLYFSVLIALLCSACSKDLVPEYKIRVIEKDAPYCTMDSSEKRANFILQCIEKANPKSDEEPEDWVRECQYMAEETFCPVLTMNITQRCEKTFSCGWFEIKRSPKLTDKGNE